MTQATLSAVGHHWKQECAGQWGEYVVNFFRYLKDCRFTNEAPSSLPLELGFNFFRCEEIKENVIKVD